MMSKHLRRLKLCMLLGVWGSFLATAEMASAADQVTRSALRLRVGETGKVGTFGGHSKDCTRSIPPEIRIARAPARGTVSQRENVPYVAKVSISGTCLGAQFIGTEVDYTAMSPGSDTMVLEAMFSNGLRRHTVSITNR